MSVHPFLVRIWRAQVADRLAVAEGADPGSDPIEHRLDEYRACIAELDAWAAELEDVAAIDAVARRDDGDRTASATERNA